MEHLWDTHTQNKHILVEAIGLQIRPIRADRRDGHGQRGPARGWGRRGKGRQCKQEYPNCFDLIEHVQVDKGTRVILKR